MKAEIVVGPSGQQLLITPADYYERPEFRRFINALCAQREDDVRRGVLANGSDLQEAVMTDQNEETKPADETQPEGHEGATEQPPSPQGDGDPRDPNASE